MQKLWYTGYVVAGLSWLLLLYVEWQIPGFASQVFPIYWLLIIAVICGLGALVSSSLEPSRRIEPQLVAALLTGAALSILVFKATEVFEAYRLILAVLALLLPALLVKSLTSKT